MPLKGGGPPPGGLAPSSKSVKSLPTREKQKQPDDEAAASGSASSSKKAQKQPVKPQVSVTKSTVSSTATSPAPSVAASTSGKKTPRVLATRPTGPDQKGWRNPINPELPFEPEPRYQKPPRGGSKKAVPGKSKKPVSEEIVLGEPIRRPVLSLTPGVSPWGSSTVSCTSSPHSEPTVDRRRKPRFFKKTHYDVDEIVHTEDKPPRLLSRTALMLGTGQGGTFSYGPHFTQRNDKGQLEQILDVKAREIGSTKVRHLRSYGEDVDWIGTKECISCIGIYFEITNNRVFCVHLNAWMTETGSNRILLSGDHEYQDLFHQFTKKMEAHAYAHGWDPNEDVLKDSVQLVSPHGHVLGFAIQDALWHFLKSPKRPKTKEAHGFLIVPKKRAPSGKVIGKILETRWILEEPVDEDEDEVPRWEFEVDDVPSNFTVVDYTELNGRLVADEWTLTAGSGWSVPGSTRFHRYPDPDD